MHAFLFGSCRGEVDDILPYVKVLGIVPTLQEALDSVSEYFLNDEGDLVLESSDQNPYIDDSEFGWYFVDEYEDNAAIRRWTRDGSEWVVTKL